MSKATTRYEIRKAGDDDELITRCSDYDDAVRRISTLSDSYYVAERTGRKMKRLNVEKMSVNEARSQMRAAYWDRVSDGLTDHDDNDDQ